MGWLRDRLGIEPKDGYSLWEGGPVPKGSAGITFGSLVIIRRGYLVGERGARLLSHELVHVEQWSELGYFGFLRQYLGAYFDGRRRGLSHRSAYLAIPLEREAVERSLVSSGPPLFP